MKTFIIQCDKNKLPTTDLGYQLIKAIEFNQWYHGNLMPDYNYLLSESITPGHMPFYPVGSVEFMQSWFDLYNIKVKPLNVPPSLEYFAKRDIIRTKDEDFKKTCEWYSFNGYYIVKDNDKIKGFCERVNFPDLREDGINYTEMFNLTHAFISEYVEDIQSEWRCFVFNGELLDCRHYLGDFKITPSYPMIEQLIEEIPYGAYTVDVGVSMTRGTILIEMHQFFSCGLYGFFDPNNLPLMLIDTLDRILKNKKEQEDSEMRNFTPEEKSGYRKYINTFFKSTGKKIYDLD